MISTALSAAAPGIGAGATFGLSAAIPALLALAKGNTKLKTGRYAGLDIPTAWAKAKQEFPNATPEEYQALFGIGGAAPAQSNNANPVIPSIPNGVIMADQPMSEIPPGGVLPNSTMPPTLRPPAAPGTSPLDVLGKIFGLDPSKGDLGSQLIKLGVPLTSAILNGVSASRAAGVQATAADRSAQLAADAAKNSLDFEKQVYGDQQTQTAPYREAGTAALDRIQSLLGIGANPNGADATATLQKQPGYQLNLTEGLKAINNASRGVVSGHTLKAADRFANDYAGNYLDKTLGQLNTVAGLGQTGVGQNNAAGTGALNTNTAINTNTAQQVGQSGEQAAAARASGYGNGVFSQVLNQLQKQQILKGLGL